MKELRIFNSRINSVILLLIMVFALNNTSFFALEANCEQLLFSKKEILKKSRDDFKQGRYSSVISRLESLFLSGEGGNDAKELLFTAYEAVVRIAYKKKNYSQAIKMVKKMLRLKPQEKKWIAILHNLYFRMRLYTEGIPYGKNILKNSDKLGLSKDEIGRTHGRQAMFYASINEKEKFLRELSFSLDNLKNSKQIRKYLKNIIPEPFKNDVFIKILKESKTISDKNREILLNIAEENIRKIENAENKKEIVHVPPEVIADKKKVIEKNVEETEEEKKEEEKISLPVETPVEKENSLFKPKKEIYLSFLEEADKLFKEKKYDEALKAYRSAYEIAPPKKLKEIDRKIFSVYFAQNRLKIEIAGYGIIAGLLILLLYFLGFFRRKSDYGLISPSKSLSKGLKLIEKEKWDAAIVQFSKIPEASLKREDSIKVSLNLALAFMEKNNTANSILHARRALKKDPGNVDANLILGKVYLKLGDNTLRAMEVFEMLGERNLANIKMLKALCAHYVRRNIISEKSYKIAIDVQRYDPEDLLSSQIITKWYHHNNRIDDEALAFMKRVAEQLPKDLQIKIFLLEIYFRRKDYKSVVREAMYIFPLNVDNVIVHSLFIDSIVRLKQFRMLLTEYERLCTENPGSIVVKYIFQSLHSLLVKKRQYPETDIALSLKVNFTVCPKCFHLNLSEFNNCQKCKSQLNP